MNGVIYARYSSDNQREESIKGQLRECKAFAEHNRITIVGEYIDRAKSATTDKRPDFQRMIKNSSQHAFEVVIVWKLDRFARNRYDSANYKAQLRKQGVKVISATESISEGAEGVLLESLLEGMAEYYSKELGEKTLRGMTENALKCKYNGGPKPLGYLIDEDKHYQIDPDFAPIIEKIFNLYAEGLGIKDIETILRNKGIVNQKGKPIGITTLANILRSRKYIGEYKFGETVIPNGMPAIVSEELFNKVQHMLDVNRTHGGKYCCTEDYILSTKLFCGKCKAMMTGESGTARSGVVYRYYKCNNARKHLCDKKTIKKDFIEGIVLNEIATMLNSDENIERIVDTVIKAQSQESTFLSQLQNELREVESSIDNLLNAIQMGIVTMSTKKRLEELEQKQADLQREIGCETIAHKPLDRLEVKAYFESYRKYDLAKQEHKRKLINTFVNEIYLYDDRLLITLFNGDKEVEVLLDEIDEIGTESVSDTLSRLGGIGEPQKDKSMTCLFLFAYTLLKVKTFGLVGGLDFFNLYANDLLFQMFFEESFNRVPIKFRRNRRRKCVTCSLNC